MFIFILNINNTEWRQEDRETSETWSDTVMSLYCQACVHDCLYMTERPSVGFIWAYTSYWIHWTFKHHCRHTNLQVVKPENTFLMLEGLFISFCHIWPLSEVDGLDSSHTEAVRCESNQFKNIPLQLTVDTRSQHRYFTSSWEQSHFTNTMTKIFFILFELSNNILAFTVLF